MKFKRLSFGTFGLLAVGGLVGGCSGKAEDCNANKSCGHYGGAAGSSAAGASGVGASGGHGGMSGGSGANGASGAAGTGGGTPACDPNANPAAEACVISSKYGLFVAPDGSDTGNGTKEKPFASLSKALEVAGAGALKRIYVCAAPYSESETLVIPNRVEIYGGFACGVWSYAVNANQKAFITSSKSVAAMIDSANLGVILQDVRIDASDAPANNPSSSSFGLMINDSTALLERVEIRAGKATAGKDGDVGTAGKGGDDPVAVQNGTAVFCGAGVAKGGVASIVSACSSVGGDGGKGYMDSVSGSGAPGTPLTNLHPPGVVNGGAGASQVGSSFAGKNGDPGFQGISGTNGAVAPNVGTFDVNGYAVASGGDGANGYPGQGGGGGGASLGNGMCTGASGGAGGMGGCAGHFGTGGTGGGASVAVLSWNSAVTIDGSIFAASAGGAGGKGAAGGGGGAGKKGGNGGLGNGAIGNAGNGGYGGYGGRGGSGAGGSGGPSIALFYSGSAPILMNAPTLTASAAQAAKGVGGQVDLADPDSKAPDGSVGITAAMYPPPAKL